MPRSPLALVGLTIAVLVAPASASAISISTNAKCYVPGEPIGLDGIGWTPGSAFGVTGTGGLQTTGFADALGDWTAQLETPQITGSGIKPVKLKLEATQDGAPVATTTVRVVNFLVQPKQLTGDPTKSTTWIFGGFLPGKSIYFHVKRGDSVYRLKAGKGDKTCGTLKKTLPRVPGVPASQIHDGKYKVFVDNRKAFAKGGRQYTATITIT